MTQPSQTLRTPDACFQNLPGYDFAPQYLDDLLGYAGMRVHYLDEGDSDAVQTFLCLHGEPSWSYLYRHMIPVFTAAGHRVVAPDLFGFGRSDKPVDDAVYTWDFHRNMLLRFVERLDLRNITLVCQDWGGILGLTLPMEMPDRFKRLIVMNTALGTGDVPLGKGFEAWRAYCASTPDLPVGGLFKRSDDQLTDAEIAAYDAPFPDASYKAGVRRFPQLVPDHPDAPGAEVSRRARDWWAREWQGQAFMAIGMQDPVLGPPAMYALHKLIPGCSEPLEVPDAGHFVQERGRVIAQAALEYFG